MEKLRECPFCGHSDIKIDTVQRYDDECQENGFESTVCCEECCGRLSAWAFKKEYAEDGIIAAWNTRASDSEIAELRAEVERLTGMINASKPCGCCEYQYTDDCQMEVCMEPCSSFVVGGKFKIRSRKPEGSGSDVR